MRAGDTDGDRERLLGGDDADGDDAGAGDAAVLLIGMALETADTPDTTFSAETPATMAYAI